jgi:hypothetical protein
MKVLSLDEQWEALLSKYSNATEFLSKSLIDQCFGVEEEKPHISIKFVYNYAEDRWGAIASYRHWNIHIPAELLNLENNIPIFHQKSKVYAVLLHILKLPCLSRK